MKLNLNLMKTTSNMLLVYIVVGIVFVLITVMKTE